MSAGLAPSRRTKPFEGTGSHVSDVEDGELNDREVVPKIANFEPKRDYGDNLSRRSSEKDQNHELHLFSSQHGHRKRPRSPTGGQSDRHNYNSPPKMPQSEPSRFSLNSTTNSTMAMPKHQSHRDTIHQARNSGRYHDDKQASTSRIPTYSASYSKRLLPGDDRLRSAHKVDHNTSTATTGEGRYRDHSPSNRDRKSRDENERGSRGSELLDLANGTNQQRSHRGVTEREMCNPRVDRHYNSSYNIDRKESRSYEDRRGHHEDYKPRERDRYESKSSYNRTSDSIRRPEKSYGRHDHVSSSSQRRYSLEQQSQPSRYDSATRRSNVESSTTALSSTLRGRDRFEREASDLFSTIESHTNVFTSRYASRVQQASTAKLRPRSRSPSPLASSLRGVGRRSSYEGNASRSWETSDSSRHESSSRYRKTEETAYESYSGPLSPSRVSLHRYDTGRSSTSWEHDVDSSTRRNVGTYIGQRSDRSAGRYQNDYSKRSPSPTITPYARNARRDSSSARQVLHDPFPADTQASSRKSYYDSNRGRDHRDRNNLSRQPERDLSSNGRSIDIGRDVDRKAMRSPSPPNFSSSLHGGSSRKPRDVEGRLHHNQQYNKRDTSDWQDSYAERNEKYDADSSLDPTSLMNTSELYKEDRDTVRSKFTSDNWRRTTGDEKKDQWHDSRVERQRQQDNALKSEPASKSLGSRWCPPSSTRKSSSDTTSKLLSESDSPKSGANATLRVTSGSDGTHNLRNESDVNSTVKTRGGPDGADTTFAAISAPVEKIPNGRDSSRREFQSGRPNDIPALTKPPKPGMDSKYSSMRIAHNSDAGGAGSAHLSALPECAKQNDSGKSDSVAAASITSSAFNEPSVALAKSSQYVSKQKVARKETSPKSSLGIPMKWLKPAARPPKKNPSPGKQLSSVVRSAASAEMKSSLTAVKNTPTDVISNGMPGFATKGNKHTTSSLGSKEERASAKEATKKRTVVKTDSDLVDPTNYCPPKKRAKKMENGRCSSPASNAVHRTVTDSEGGSTVSNEQRVAGERRRDGTIPSTINGRNEADMAGATPELTLDDSLTASMDAVESKKRAVTSVPSVIVKKKSTGASCRGAFDDDTLMESPSHPHSREFSASSSDVSSSGSDDDDSDTDEEEVMMWAAKMFGLSHSSPQDARPKKKATGSSMASSHVDKTKGTKPKLHLRLSQVKAIPSADHSNVELDKKKMLKKAKKKKKDRLLVQDGVDGAPSLDSSSRVEEKAARKKDKKMKKKLKKILRTKEPDPEEEAVDEAAMEREMAEDRRKREMAKPLTAAQIRAILGDDWDGGSGSGGGGWVRRSTRQPLRSFLNSNQMQGFLHKLKTNDSDMVVLKMKKFISDPNVPQVVLDAALDALELNTNCEALYIQVSDSLAASCPSFGQNLIYFCLCITE